MWFDPGLAGLFITSTLLHLGEDINLLVVSVTKTVTFQGVKGEIIVFKGERVSNPTNIISVMTARKLLKKGCTTYLAYVINLEKGKIGLSDIPIMRKFLDVFLEELPGLPPKKKLKSPSTYCLGCLL